MQWLKQSTAATLKIGPFVDETDGDTVEPGLTIAQADVRLSKNGGNIAQKNDATSCTYDEVGIYDCPVDATDTNTLGRLDLIVDESGALPVRHSYMVVTANVYDSLFGADTLQTDVVEVVGQTAKAEALRDNISNLDASVNTVNTTVNTINTNLNTVDTNVDDIETLVNTIDGKLDVVDANVDDIETLTMTIDSTLDTVDSNVSDVDASLLKALKKLDDLRTILLEANSRR